MLSARTCAERKGFRLYSGIFACLIVYLITLVMAPSLLADDHLKIANSDWPPFSGEQLPGQGFATELVTTAFKRAGYEPETMFLPWFRGLNGTRRGSYDVLLNVTTPQITSSDLLLSAPYTAIDLVLLGPRGSRGEIATLNSLDGKRIGVVDGISYFDAFDTHNGLVRDEGPSLTHNIMKLLSARVDYVIANRAHAVNVLQDKFAADMDRLTFLDPVLYTQNVHLAVSAAHPQRRQLLSTFNRELAEMRRDGSYEKLLRKHNLANRVLGLKSDATN